MAIYDTDLDHFGMRVVQGRTEYDSIDKFGVVFEKNIVDAPFDVWSSGSDYTGFVSTADTVDIVSSSTDDATIRDGAHLVEIFGLDENFVAQSEIIELDGTSAVTSLKSYIRLNRMIVRVAGSVGGNVGVITARQTNTPLNVFATIIEGDNQTLVCVYTVEANCELYLTDLEVAMSRANGSSGSARIQLLVRPFGEVFQVKREYNITTSYPMSTSPWIIPLKITEKSDIKVRVVSVSDNNTSVTAVMYGFIQKIT